MCCFTHIHVVFVSFCIHVHLYLCVCKHIAYANQCGLVYIHEAISSPSFTLCAYPPQVPGTEVAVCVEFVYNVSSIDFAPSVAMVTCYFGDM